MRRLQPTLVMDNTDGGGVYLLLSWCWYWLLALNWSWSQVISRRCSGSDCWQSRWRLWLMSRPGDRTTLLPSVQCPLQCPPTRPLLHDKRLSSSPLSSQTLCLSLISSSSLECFLTVLSSANWNPAKRLSNEEPSWTVMLATLQSEIQLPAQPTGNWKRSRLQ